MKIRFTVPATVAVDGVGYDVRTFKAGDEVILAPALAQEQVRQGLATVIGPGPTEAAVATPSEVKADDEAPVPIGSADAVKILGRRGRKAQREA